MSSRLDQLLDRWRHDPPIGDWTVPLPKTFDAVCSAVELDIIKAWDNVLDVEPERNSPPGIVRYKLYADSPLELLGEYIPPDPEANSAGEWVNYDDRESKRPRRLALGEIRIANLGDHYTELAFCAPWQPESPERQREREYWQQTIAVTFFRRQYDRRWIREAWWNEEEAEQAEQAGQDGATQITSVSAQPVITPIPVEDPTDKRILEWVTKDPDLKDQEIAQRLGIKRQAANMRRKRLEAMGHKVR